MNHLHKIVFINSASVRYQEMDLNGNIHVIGKNGTGKSSILRAILFFYSANTQKLGIKANQSSFTDFYFPHPNSWIIYEVQGTLGYFTLAAHRKSNRISFRFINGAYEREMFLDESGMAHTPKELIVQANARGLKHSRSIDKYETYRSIIYGTISGSEKTSFRKYALFEAKSHENVWRTLSNIFLNARLESQFIKKTLIDSITDRSFSIDLKVIQKELEDFTHNRKDIEIYQRFKNRPARILRDFAQLKELEQQQVLLAQDLGKSLNAGTKALQDLTERQAQQQAAIQEAEAQALSLISEEQSELHSLNKKLGIVENSLQTAKEKQTHYEKIGISKILSELAKRPALEREWENRKADYQALTSEFANVEQEFSVRLQALANEQERLEMDLLQQSREKEQEAMREREKSYQEFVENQQSAREVFQGSQKNILAELEEARTLFQELRIQEVRTRAQIFLEKEVNETQQALQDLVALPAQLQAEIGLAKEQVKQLDLREKHELEGIEAEKVRQQEETQQKIAICDARIQTLQTQIDQAQTAFIGWLEGRYPDWQKSIGKVCREEVLFHPYLSPSIERLNELLFGVQIDLEELEVEVPSPENLQQELQKQEQQKDSLQKEWITFVQDWEKKQRNCEKRYRQKRKAIGKNIQKHENQLEQTKLQQKKLRLQLDQIEQHAQQLKEKELLHLQFKLQEQKDLIQASQKRLQKLETDFETQLKQLQSDQQTRMEQIHQSQLQVLQEVEQQKTEAIQQFEQRKTNILKEKNQILSGKGIDTEQLEQLQIAILKLETDLKHLDSQQQTVILYRRDKEEYIDQIDPFQLTIQRLGNQIQEVQESFAKSRAKQERILQEIRGSIGETKQAKTRWEEEFKSYELFRQSPLFEKIEPTLTGAIESQIVQSLHILIQQLNTNDQEISVTWERMRKQITAFLGHFRTANILNFPESLSSEEAYRAFARALEEFVETNKIEDFEREINKQYAQLVSKISDEVRALSSLEDEIQKIISRINRSFRDSNFVGVVKEIQLKMEDSTNAVVNALKHIKTFDDENGMQLGGPSLFNQTDSSETNRKAIALLELLTESLKGYKEDQLQLEDTFQLAFRVRENQNDTGWVERLSSVGSNGTDVLVKAMIYITLLSVFKDRSSKKKQDFRLHCIIDEVGILDTSYLQDLITFANAKNITLINGSPNENNPLAYTHIYQVRRDDQDYVRVHRLISQVGVN